MVQLLSLLDPQGFAVALKDELIYLSGDMPQHRRSGRHSRSKRNDYLKRILPRESF